MASIGFMSPFYGRLCCLYVIQLIFSFPRAFGFLTHVQNIVLPNCAILDDKDKTLMLVPSSIKEKRRKVTEPVAYRIFRIALEWFIGLCCHQ